MQYLMLESNDKQGMGSFLNSTVDRFMIIYTNYNRLLQVCIFSSFGLSNRELSKLRASQLNIVDFVLLMPHSCC